MKSDAQLSVRHLASALRQHNDARTAFYRTAGVEDAGRAALVVAQPKRFVGEHCCRHAVDSSTIWFSSALSRQAVEFVDQLVDLPVGGFKLTLKDRLLVVGLCLRKSLVQG